MNNLNQFVENLLQENTKQELECNYQKKYIGALENHIEILKETVALLENRISMLQEDNHLKNI